MNRLVLLQLEKEFEETLDWGRREVKKRAAPMMVQGYLPPEEYVIQGLMPAPPSKAPKHRGCRGCRFYHPAKKCLIKWRMRLVHKSYCPKKYMKKPSVEEGWPPIFVKEKIVYDRERQMFRSVRIIITPLCRGCDFFDKVAKYCILQLAGRPCIFNIKRAAQPAKRTVNPLSRYV